MRHNSFIAATAVLAVLSLGPAIADSPGRHPHYLHGLSDLRTAHWLVERRSEDAMANAHEAVAREEIERAIGDLKQAAIDDGKDIREHEAIAFPPERRGRLHEAMRLLQRAHGDVDQEEDDPFARGLKHRTLEHIDHAIGQLEGAIEDIEHHQ